MQVVLKFWTRLIMWTGVLVVVFFSLSLVGAGGWAAAVSHLPVWGGLALVLASFPAGLAVTTDVFPGRIPTWRTLGVSLGAVVATCLITLVLVGFAGPVVQRWLGGDTAINEEPALELSLFELRSVVMRAVEDAERDPDRRDIAHWIRANRLLWQYDSRWTAAVLPFLFAWIGILTGVWTRMTPRRDVQLMQHWALGLFLVMSTYLAGENSYELIVVHAAGPAYFAGILRLVVPTLLFGILAWITALDVWSRLVGNQNIDAPNPR